MFLCNIVPTHNLLLLTRLGIFSRKIVFTCVPIRIDQNCHNIKNYHDIKSNYHVIPNITISQIIVT